MALHWNLEKIADHDKLWLPAPTESDKDGCILSGVTEALIWASMSVDLGSITEQNIPEWIWRLAFLQEISKADFLLEKTAEDKPPKSRNFTVEEVKRHIGLTTNVITESRAKFVRRWTDHIRREADWRQRRMLDGKS